MTKYKCKLYTEIINLSQEVLEMPVIKCPHCGNGADFNLKAQTTQHVEQRQGYWSAIGDCVLCHQEVYFRLHGQIQQVIDSYPRLIENAPNELPDKVKRPFEEALKSKAAGAPNAALCMLRRALQETLDDLDAQKGNLPTQLQALVDAHKITPDLKEWADHARIGGRLAAHGTGGEDWGDASLEWGQQSDAEAVQDFLSSFLEYVYIMPERNRQRRERRNN